MKRSRGTVGFVATAACLLVVSAVTLAAGCNRMLGAAQRDCLRAADAARESAMIRALDLNFPPPTEGTAGSESPTPPGKWMLPAVEPVPDNLARNTPR